ncbi:MAG TPA: hypothetical protein VNI20_06625 [Fimbriimonadaceae bacterium]|nr:hypothetical protein [Fimbriimonadaceae bacterium]
MVVALLPGQAAPVTKAEAEAAIGKVDSAIRKVIGLPAAEAKKVTDSTPISRAEFVKRLDSMFESYRPKFQYTPRPFHTDPAVVAKFNQDPGVQKRIDKLARWGCLAPVGPVVVGPGDTLTTSEFGDALGYFMSQIASLTYFADPKWVPNLGGGGDLTK